MFNKDHSILQLFWELDRKIKANQIGFWIEDQDCYLWENTFHYSNKIKIGDLSQTKENYYLEMFSKLKELAQEKEARGKFLDSKFQAISDVELIEELAKRKATIKLILYAGNQTVFIEAQDVECKTGITLPIEIKTKD